MAGSIEYVIEIKGVDVARIADFDAAAEQQAVALENFDLGARGPLPADLCDHPVVPVVWEETVLHDRLIEDRNLA